MRNFFYLGSNDFKSCFEEMKAHLFTDQSTNLNFHPVSRFQINNVFLFYVGEHIAQKCVCLVTGGLRAIISLLQVGQLSDYDITRLLKQTHFVLTLAYGNRMKKWWWVPNYNFPEALRKDTLISHSCASLVTALFTLSGLLYHWVVLTVL